MSVTGLAMNKENSSKLWKIIQEADDYFKGEDPGSAENPKMLKKFIYCTGITTILFIIIYLLMKFEYLNLRNIII